MSGPHGAWKRGYICQNSSSCTISVGRSRVHLIPDQADFGNLPDRVSQRQMKRSECWPGIPFSAGSAGSSTAGLLPRSAQVGTAERPHWLARTAGISLPAGG